MILVTGASGFVGMTLCKDLLNHSSLRILVRDKFKIDFYKKT